MRIFIYIIYIDPAAHHVYVLRLHTSHCTPLLSTAMVEPLPRDECGAVLLVLRLGHPDLLVASHRGKHRAADPNAVPPLSGGASVERDAVRLVGDRVDATATRRVLQLRVETLGEAAEARAATGEHDVPQELLVALWVDQHETS